LLQVAQLSRDRGQTGGLNNNPRVRKVRQVG